MVELTGTIVLSQFRRPEASKGGGVGSNMYGICRSEHTISSARVFNYTALTRKGFRSSRGTRDELLRCYFGKV